MHRAIPGFIFWIARVAVLTDSAQDTPNNNVTEGWTEAGLDNMDGLPEMQHDPGVILLLGYNHASFYVVLQQPIQHWARGYKRYFSGLNDI